MFFAAEVCRILSKSFQRKNAVNAFLIPHNPLGPVSTAACLQICASIPNLGIQELPTFCLNGAEDAMVTEPLTFKDGYLTIPEAPGIGIELT